MEEGDFFSFSLLRSSGRRDAFLGFGREINSLIAGDFRVHSCTPNSNIYTQKFRVLHS